ncbi:hypothetical protein [uncultured Treponema sp.]|uniref:hypothetical protein n=1 Tax=uncultured Treponema sp. TaxID=162155 RepID=UPI00259429C1|nr:hypothetical protein [uncultured Treponema sp.]
MKKYWFWLIIIVIVYLIFFIPTGNEIIDKLCENPKQGFIAVLESIETWKLNIIAIGSAFFTLVGTILTVKQCIDTKKVADAVNDTKIEVLRKTQDFYNFKRKLTTNASQKERFKSIKLEIRDLKSKCKNKPINFSDKKIQNIRNFLRDMLEEPTMNSNIEKIINEILDEYKDILKAADLDDLDAKITKIIKLLNIDIGD